MVKLEDYTLKELKAMASKYNKYAKIKFSHEGKALKKNELISKIRNHPNLNVVEGAQGVEISVKASEVEEVEKQVKERKKKEPKKKAEPKKILEYEKAWAYGSFNSSQRPLIARMTNERRKEVLKLLGLSEKAEPKKKAEPKTKEQKAVADVISTKKMEKMLKQGKSKAEIKAEFVKQANAKLAKDKGGKKKERSEKQKANDKKLGEMAKKKKK